MRSQGQPALSPPTTLYRAYVPGNHAPSTLPEHGRETLQNPEQIWNNAVRIQQYNRIGSTAKGIMIGIFSVLGAALLVLILAAIVYYFRYTQQGRIFLDRITRPGEYDDEQQFAKEEAEALEEMDDIQRTEYLRAKGRLLYLGRLRAPSLTVCSLRSGESPRIGADRHILIPVLGNTREGGVCMGV
jgi:hypothetical protein